MDLPWMYLHDGGLFVASLVHLQAVDGASWLPSTNLSPTQTFLQAVLA
jgi:hypothetical protein